jgi:tetratricopeptide (TPR) repeat protein
LLKRCLILAAETIGIMHPETVAAREQLAEAYRRAGRPNEAIGLYQDALAQVQKGTGATRPDAVRTREGLALAYHRAGRIDDAATAFERALAEWRRVAEADAANTLATRASLAAIYCRTGRAKQRSRSLRVCSRTAAGYAGQPIRIHSPPGGMWPLPATTQGVIPRRSISARLCWKSVSRR